MNCTRLLCPWNSPGKNTAVGGAIPVSKGSSQIRDWTWVSHIAGRFFNIWTRVEELWFRRYACWGVPDAFGWSWPIRNWFWSWVAKERGFPGGSTVKNPPAIQESWARSFGQEDPLEKEMTTHSSILAWEIPWMEEPDMLQSRRSQESDITERLNYHYQRWKSCRRENHICLVYRDVLTWPTCTTTKTKDFDAKKLTTNNHTPPPLVYKKSEF